MKEKLNMTIKLGFILICLLFFYPELFAQDQTTTTFEYAEDNQQCLKCHGSTYYNYYNTGIEKIIRERMNPYFIVDSAEYYQANHRNFSCTDCHSSDYSKFPHAGELRMEPKMSCMDCHGGDDTYAKFNFDKIEEEFNRSVHSSEHLDEFTCWTCHNPHSYKISARTNQLKKTIQYSNDICLSCHEDVSKYQLFTNQKNPNILETHDWLPNQALHFKSVRCIECHTEINNDILVAHNVQAKEKAVQSCVECHSQNSLLMETLYKYQNEGKSYSEDRGDAMEKPQLIGANRNYILNFSSILIFLMVIGGIGIHIVLRIIFKSR